MRAKAEIRNLKGEGRPKIKGRRSDFDERLPNVQPSVLPDFRSASAFTLIEVILSLAIFAIVLVAINTAFFAALRLRQHASDAVESALPMQRTLGLMRRDLQNATPPGGVLAGDFRSAGPSGTASAKGAPSSIAGGQNGGLDFFTSTGALSDDLPWGDIQEVNYQLMDPSDRSQSYGKDLVRSVTRNLLATSTQTADTQRLLSNVDTLDFFYFDGTQWRDTWDTSAGDTNLPQAVRVRIQMAADPASGNRAPEPLQMVVLVDSQGSATNR
jgi:type II secretion system protein J